MAQTPLPGTDRQKCIELTAAGTRCTRWAYSDTDRCRQHGELVKPRTPTGLSAADQEALFDALESGLALDEAVTVAGVSRSTVYDWLSKAKVEGMSTEYAAFAAGVERARTELERKTLKQMSAQAAKGNVRAQIFLLQMINPGRYSGKVAGQMRLPTEPKRKPANDEEEVPDNVVPMRPVAGNADW